MAVRPPQLMSAPDAYEPGAFERILSELRAYFVRANVPYPHTASTLNINLKTLPTQTSLANLADGEVYLDTTDGTLKIKDSSAAPLRAGKITGRMYYMGNL